MLSQRLLVGGNEAANKACLGCGVELPVDWLSQREAVEDVACLC